MQVIKRDGRAVTYDRSKIILAIQKANSEVEPCEKISDEKIEEIVLGHPKNMDGTVGPRAEKCETLAKELEERTGLHVVLWDERRTTVAAHEILHRSGKKEKKHRQSVDAVAATLILQGYLDFKRRQ